MTDTQDGYIIGPAMNSQTCECHSRRKHRSEEEFKSLQNRLSRIEGQVRGLRRMLEEEIIYRSADGYMVYDRFFGQWLDVRF